MTFGCMDTFNTQGFQYLLTWYTPGNINGNKSSSPVDSNITSSAVEIKKTNIYHPISIVSIFLGVSSMGGKYDHYDAGQAVWWLYRL